MNENQDFGQAGATPQPVPQPEGLPVTEQPLVGYGYVEDTPQTEQLGFGLQAGTARLSKFEFNPNGGAEGAEQDCVDIVVSISGRDMNARTFPVTRAYDNNVEITDPRHPEFQKALKVMNANIIHILKTFVTDEAIRTALSTPITSFEQFIRTCTALLPNGYQEVPLDTFLQYEWQIREDNDRTWLRLPKNIKHGHWLCKHVPPVNGDWTEKITGGRLTYVDGSNNEHPFIRGKWFTESAFARKQEQQGVQSLDTGTGDQAPTSGGNNW